jgi:hypothetical protein
MKSPPGPQPSFLKQQPTQALPVIGSDVKPAPEAVPAANPIPAQLPVI